MEASVPDSQEESTLSESKLRRRILNTGTGEKWKIWSEWDVDKKNWIFRPHSPLF